MELTLNIRNEKNEVVETKTAQLWDLKTGVVKKLFTIIEIENMMASCKTTDAIIGYIVGKTQASWPIMENVLKDIFGVTSEEIDNGTSISEVAEIVMLIMIETVTRLSSIGENLKNLLRAELLENSVLTETSK